MVYWPRHSGGLQPGGLLSASSLMGGLVYPLPSGVLPDSIRGLLRMAHGNLHTAAVGYKAQLGGHPAYPRSVGSVVLACICAGCSTPGSLLGEAQS